MEKDEVEQCTVCKKKRYLLLVVGCGPQSQKFIHMQDGVTGGGNRSQFTAAPCTGM